MTDECRKCGACCRAATPEFLESFGLQVGHDGHCAYLDASGECRIFEHRPDVCRSEHAYKIVSGWMTRAEYDEAVRRACFHLRLSAEYSAEKESKS